MKISARLTGITLFMIGLLLSACSNGGENGSSDSSSSSSSSNSSSSSTSSSSTSSSSGISSSGARSLGFIGCSMAENVAQGYEAVGGTRLWPPYGTGGAVVQSWTDTDSSAWQNFDQQATQYGKPSTVWIQICIFVWNGVTYNEVKQLIANAREHAAPGATIYISGQPLYEAGWTCDLAGSGGPELTDQMAQQAGNDSSQSVTYLGTWGPLDQDTTSDTCHANQAGQLLLGEQAVGYFGS